MVVGRAGPTRSLAALLGGSDHLGKMWDTLETTRFTAVYMGIVEGSWG